MTIVHKGDWVKYRNGQALVVTEKVLEKRPDGVLVVGQHDNDPNPSQVKQDDVIDTL